jgi:flagellar biosynthesis/type III secretory pathway chaperone
MARVLQPLTDALDRELAAGVRLLAALETERTRLADGDAAALETAVAEKERLLAEFETTEAARRSALSALGYPPDRAGVTACLRAHEDPNYRDDATRAGPVAARWRRLLAVTAQLRDANERNGMIVSLRSRRVREALNVLRTGRPDELTYGPTRIGPPARRAIGRA